MLQHKIEHITATIRLHKDKSETTNHKFVKNPNTPTNKHKFKGETKFSSSYVPSCDATSRYSPNQADVLQSPTSSALQNKLTQFTKRYTQSAQSTIYIHEQF